MADENRRTFLTSVAMAAGSLPLAAIARQTPRRPRRIGFLIGNEPSLVDAFTQALKGLGYDDERALVVETRIGTGADMARYAKELATSDLDLVVAAALPQALEIRRANPAMPMVIGTCPGMISNGFAASLEHPGGNVTGMDELPAGVTLKRLRLLKTAVPSISQVGLLSTAPGTGEIGRASCRERV